MGYREITPEEITGNPFEKIGRQWMLVTAEKEGKINTMTASWGGMGVLWRKNVVFVFIRPQRYTKEFVDANEKFTLSFYGPEHKEKLSYFGTVSGRDENKIEKAGFTPASFGGAPAFDQAELVLTCKKLYAQEIDSGCFMKDSGCDAECYPSKDYHTMYVAEVETAFVKE